MVLLVYLLVFSVAFWLRHRSLTGKDLSFKINPAGKTYFENIQYTNKRRNRVSPSLGLPLDTPLNFIVSREKWYHRFLKSTGLAQEMQTGDAALDERLFFACEWPESLKQLMEKQSFQAAVKTLFMDLDAKALRSFSGKIWVQGKTVDTVVYTPQYASQHLRQLNTIVEEFTAADLYASPVGTEGWLTHTKAAILLMTCHAALLTMGLFGGLPVVFGTTGVVDWWQLIGLAAIVGAAAAGLWIYLIALLVGRGSWLPMVVADFTLMGLVGIFLSGAFVLFEANIYLDTAEAVPYIQPITQKECSLTCSSGSGKRRHSSHYSLSDDQCAAGTRETTQDEYASRDYKCNRRGSFSYKLTVPPWTPEQNKNYTFPVSVTLYDQMNIGDSVRIPAHPGAFKITWVDTAEISPDGQ